MERRPQDSPCSRAVLARLAGHAIHPAGRRVLQAIAAIVAVAAISAGVAAVLETGGSQPAAAAPAPTTTAITVPAPTTTATTVPAPTTTATTALGDTHVHAAGAAPTDASGQGAPHFHGNEVLVSEDNLRRALAFVDQVKAATAKYTDVRAALAAGYVQVTQDLPGIAAHFVRIDFLDDGIQLDPEKPEALLYSKRLDGAWRLVGVMFQTRTDGTLDGDPPSYFGGLDVWHYHEDLCFTSQGVSVTPDAASCPGTFIKRTGWELHVWVLPGAGGLFAHDYAPITPGKFPPATSPAAVDLRLADAGPH